MIPKVMDERPVVPNAYYLMFYGNGKFKSLCKHYHQSHAWFVTRAPNSLLYIVIDFRAEILKGAYSR